MISISDKKNCCGCKACYNVCPKNSIEMVSDNEGFWYPNVDKNKCVHCGLCEKVCPEINIYSNHKSKDNPMCLAAWSNDNDIRSESSSGGVFTSIAQWILSSNGVVFGAGYDSNLNVVHKEVQALDGLKDLRGSKYVQSDINDTYKKAKQCLVDGKKVLFTGTPCQIAGLYNYIQKEYEELYTCDLVCHGVPSPAVYKKFIDYLNCQYKSEAENISFRNKEHGWKNYSFSIRFTNGKVYSKLGRDNSYIIGFLRDYFLRPSCYSCKHKKMPRYGDITLADFWGVGGKYPEIDDDRGTSLVLINTEKGNKILEKCKNNIFKQVCDLNYAVQNNPCIVKASEKPKQREMFFKDFNRKEFNYIIKKYMSSPSWLKKRVMSIINILRFIKRKIIK